MLLKAFLKYSNWKVDGKNPYTFSNLPFGICAISTIRYQVAIFRHCTSAGTVPGEGKTAAKTPKPNTHSIDHSGSGIRW